MHSTPSPECWPSILHHFATLSQHISPPISSKYYEIKLPGLVFCILFGYSIATTRLIILKTLLFIAMVIEHKTRKLSKRCCCLCKGNAYRLPSPAWLTRNRPTETLNPKPIQAKPKELMWACLCVCAYRMPNVLPNYKRRLWLPCTGLNT